jgi:rSAM/selenodomain-associated transferase 2
MTPPWAVPAALPAAVIVPVLDEARLIDALVPRLAALAGEAEVVVVDGGSRDGTRERLAAAAPGAGFRLIGAPAGRARQMNAGAAATSAPVLLFLHADTALPPGGPALAARAVAAGAAGGCFSLAIDSRDPRLRLAAAIISLRSRLLPSASGDQAIFAARAVFERLGGYRPLPLCEDLDLVGRLGRAGRFVCLPEVVHTSARRWHARGVGATIALMWTLRLGYHLGVPPSLLARLYGPAAR